MIIETYLKNVQLYSLDLVTELPPYDVATGMVDLFVNTHYTWV